MTRRVCSMVLLVAVLALPQVALAAPPALNVDVSGLELLPQSIAGAAIFIFQVQGEVDGRQRSGWGWIAANHETLPEGVGDSSAITGGSGAIWVGFRRYDVQITGGSLTLTDTKDPAIFDDAFGVVMNANIRRSGQSAAHTFAGELDHEPFPPTIIGELGANP